MAEKKLVDSKWVKVIVEHRNPETEAISSFVGGNGIIINGKSTIKHFRFKIGEEIEIPESFVDQLKNRSMVGKDKDNNRISIPQYIVREV